MNCINLAASVGECCEAVHSSCYSQALNSSILLCKLWDPSSRTVVHLETQSSKCSSWLGIVRHYISYDTIIHTFNNVWLLSKCVMEGNGSSQLFTLKPCWLGLGNKSNWLDLGCKRHLSILDWQELCAEVGFGSGCCVLRIPCDRAHSSTTQSSQVM